MELRQLKIFEAVYRLNGFNAAAKSLDYSQSAVSEAVRVLEEELGITAFERLGNRIYPTAAGHTLYKEACAVLERAFQLEFMVRGRRHDSLRIGITEALTLYRFPETLQAFVAQQENMTLQIELLRIEDILTQLRDNRIDLGVVLDGEAAPKDMVELQLFDEELVLIGARDYAFDPKAPQTAIISKGMTGYNQLFHQICLKHCLDIHKSVYIESIEGIKSFVIAGLGIGFLPWATVQELILQGTLVKLRLSEERYFHQAKLLYHRDKHITPAMTAMMRHILSSPKE